MDVLTQLMGISALQVQGFVFIICRMTGLIVAAPILSHQNIPLIARIGLILMLSIIILPFVPVDKIPLYTNDMLFMTDIIKEVFVGLVFGFCTRLIFIGVQVAGEIIDYQMGFGFVNVIDPESRLQVPIIGQFLLILATLLFLVINGHHWLIRSMVKSFQVVPLLGLKFNPGLYTHIDMLFTQIFLIGFKIAAPVGIAMFLIDLAYGIIARAIPQANIMIVGFPLKIGLGLFFLWMFLPLFMMAMEKYLATFIFQLNGVFKLM